MSLNDTLSNTLSKILNSEKIGKDECLISPTSRIIEGVLEIMNRDGYAGKAVLEGRILHVPLLGKINKCGSIKPRSSVKVENIEKFEKRFLPSKGFGILIISTTKGLMTNEEAKEKGVGGRLVAYCY